MTQNPGKAVASFGNTTLISALKNDVATAISQITAMDVSPGFEAASPKNLNNWNVQNGVADVFVVNVTKDMSLNTGWDIWGDADALFIIRWDDDPSRSGDSSEVKFSGGGGIIPHGGLTPANFVNVAGKINASGGGSNPPELQTYLNKLQSPANGGGFFTGYC